MRISHLAAFDRMDDVNARWTDMSLPPICLSVVSQKQLTEFARYIIMYTKDCWANLIVVPMNWLHLTLVLYDLKRS